MNLAFVTAHHERDECSWIPSDAVAVAVAVAVADQQTAPTAQDARPTLRQRATGRRAAPAQRQSRDNGPQADNKTSGSYTDDRAP